MNKAKNSLESIISALVARSQLSLSELERRAQDLCYNGGLRYLESMAKHDISEIKSGKLVDDLTAKTEELFRTQVLTDQRLSSETRAELKSLIPYRNERQKSTLFLRP